MNALLFSRNNPNFRRIDCIAASPLATTLQIRYVRRAAILFKLCERVGF
ncbi:MAG: hypothetical protein ABSA66_13225 [Roseiarcus sp.]|jgi:hypothetical protein